MKLLKALNKEVDYTEWQMRRYMCSIAFLCGMALGALIGGAL